MNHTDITPHIIPRRQWLVAYVQSCLEKKTAERLKAMGVEYYLPIQSEIRQWSDRRKKVDRLVIPMMIFVHVTPQERPLPLTLQAVSRYMVLRGESRPAVIPDEQMERFRFMLDDHAEKTTRQRVRELFERLPVMSLSAARAAIDAAMQEDKP